jgi:hypothetical protein
MVRPNALAAAHFARVAKVQPRAAESFRRRLAYFVLKITNEMYSKRRLSHSLTHSGAA